MDATSPHARLFILQRLFPKSDTLIVTKITHQTRQCFSDLMSYLRANSHHKFIDVTALSYVQRTFRMKYKNVKSRQNATLHKTAFFYKLGKLPLETLETVNTTYKENTVHRRLVDRWYQRFRDGDKSI